MISLGFVKLSYSEPAIPAKDLKLIKYMTKNYVICAITFLKSLYWIHFFYFYFEDFKHSEKSKEWYSTLRFCHMYFIYMYMLPCIKYTSNM